MGFERIIINKPINGEGGAKAAEILRDKFTNELGIATEFSYENGTIIMVSDGLLVYIAQNGVATLTFQDGSTRNYSIDSAHAYIHNIQVANNAVILNLSHMLDPTSGTQFYPYIFTKTNTNKMAIIVSGKSTPYTICDISSGDDATATPNSYTRTNANLSSYLLYANQVQICPVICNSKVGVVSYTPEVYVATMTTLPAVRDFSFYDYVLGDYHYLTDGAFWIKGDKV